MTSGPLDDHGLARTLAVRAGERLLEIRAAAPPSMPGDRLKSIGDAAAQEVLSIALRALAPDDAVLSEEAPDDHARLASDRVWIIDPLDGTREFSERPRDDWAVHVALWERGHLVAATVALPARGQVFSTDEVGALPDRPRSGPLRLAVSRSRPPALVTALAERLGAVLIPMGSAGVKAMAVVEGTADAYVHAGGQYEWDSAAPVAVARAHGLHCSRVDGSPLAYNSESPWMPDLVVGRPELCGDLFRHLSEVAGQN